MQYPYPGWPYAAKAVIQHEWDTDHLNIWITFANKMNQLHKPLLTTWICYVDTVEMPVTVSTWQDAWTLLLTVPDIASLPARVLVAFDGPDINLYTTTLKQWEPWGPILSLDLTT